MSTESTEMTVAAAEGVVSLPEPTPELAAKALGEVGYEQHIVGLKMSAMGGSNPVTLSSLPDIAHFIQIGDYDDMLNNPNATVGYLEPAALATWISQVIGDGQLAEAVREVAGKGEFYGTVAMPIRAVLMARLDQYHAVLEPSDVPAESDESVL